MKTKQGSTPRILCVMLSLCLMAITAAPMASALGAEQEQVLQSGQRSLNNPEGTFTVPRPSAAGLLHENSASAVQMVACNVLEQFLTGHAEPQFSQVMAYAPLVLAGDALPPQKELGLSDFGEVKDVLAGMTNDLGIGFDVAKAVLTGDMRNLCIALRETQQANLYDIIVFYTNAAGEVCWSTTGLSYNAQSGFVQRVNDTGVLIGLDFDLDNFEARIPPGSGNGRFGFNIFFDIFSPLALMFLDTLRVPFEYDGKEYMIQFWKGSYFLLSNGAEVSIYERPKGRLLQWDASDTSLEMTMQVYQKDKLFFTFEPYNTWWAGGFRFGNPFSMPVLSAKDLRLAGSILFEEQAMLDAFLASFHENKPANMTGKATGLLFVYDWQAG